MNTWEEDGERLDENELFNRREEYEADVPDEVKVLTAAVDVQDDRFEIEVIGWGNGKESWGIQYHQLYGDLSQPKVWWELDEYLSRTWEKGDGRKFTIMCTCIDSGGHFTQEVYKFTKPREARRIYAIKGKGELNGQYVSLIAGYTRTKLDKALLINLGVNDGKARVMSNLKITERGPNYCHFPDGKGYNQKYFEGLTAEKLETRYKQGVAYQVWKKIRSRNEPLDLRVYNIAALEILNPNLEQMALPKPAQQQVKRKRGVVNRGISY